jgi:hypothetical protein
MERYVNIRNVQHLQWQRRIGDDAIADHRIFVTFGNVVILPKQLGQIEFFGLETAGEPDFGSYVQANVAAEVIVANHRN